MFINKSVKLKRGLLGNLTLFADYAQKNHAATIPADIQKFQTDVTFQDWEISGDKVKQNLDQTFGPILWTQYTLHRGIMKMTAQVSPMGKLNKEKAILNCSKEGSGRGYKARQFMNFSTAHFRIENWDDKQEIPYRLSFRTEIQSENGKEPFVKIRKTKAQSSWLRCHA